MKGGRRGLWNSREELESSRRIPGDIGSRLERIRGEIEKFTPDSRAGFYRAQDDRKNGKKGKLSAAT